MPDSNRAMMGWSCLCPLVDISLRTNGKTIAAVGISNVEDWAGNSFAFCNKQFHLASSVLADRENRDRSISYTHLNGQAFPGFAVIYHQRDELYFAFGNSGMTGAIVPEHDNVVIEIQCIKLRERTTCAQRIQYFHCY